MINSRWFGWQQAHYLAAFIVSYNADPVFCEEVKKKKEKRIKPADSKGKEFLEVISHMWKDCK